MCLVFWLALLQSGAITGDYIEDRANKVYGCYCEWSGEGEYGGREAVLGWHIRSGSYRAIDLSGVKIAAVIRGDRTLSRPGARRTSALVIDSNAAPAQRRAAEALMREEYGDLLGEVVAVQVASIEFRRESTGAVLRAGKLLNVEMRKARPVEDSLSGAILWYDPFIPMREATLGTTEHVEYNGRDIGIRWRRDDPGVTGYYGTFQLQPH
jgi:hypothetical protein